MLSKYSSAPIFLLALTSIVNAGCVITPGLGLPETPVAADVQDPSSAGAPCGTVNIPQNINSATSVTADADGKFPVSILNFNSSSRFISKMQVNADGTGNAFVAGQMVENGDTAPGGDGTQQLTGQIPSGTKCVGGTDKNLCVVSFVSQDNTGNCVVVKQPADATKTGKEPATTPSPSPSPSPSPNPVNQNGQQKAGDAKGNGNTGATSHNGRGFRRQRLQGKRFGASR